MNQYQTSTHLNNWIFCQEQLESKRFNVFKKAIGNSVKIREDYESYYFFRSNTLPRDGYEFSTVTTQTTDDDNEFGSPISRMTTYRNKINFLTPEINKTRSSRVNNCFSSPLHKNSYNSGGINNTTNDFDNKVNTILKGDIICIEDQQRVIFHFANKITQICKSIIYIYGDSMISSIVDVSFAVDRPSDNNQDKIDEMISLKYHYFISKSILFFRRFYLELNIIEFDIIYAIYGSILLASKVENLRLDPSLLIKCIESEIPYQLTSLNQLSSAGDEVRCNIEIKILDTINYNLIIYLPHDNVIEMVDSLASDNSIKECIKKNSIPLCENILYTDDIFLHHPSTIALCIINKIIHDNNLSVNIDDIIKNRNDNFLDKIFDYPLIVYYDDIRMNKIINTYKSSLSPVVDINYINYMRNQNNALKSLKRKRYTREPVREEKEEVLPESEEDIIGDDYQDDSNYGFSFKKICFSDESEDDEFFVHISQRQAFLP